MCVCVCVCVLGGQLPSDGPFNNLIWRQQVRARLIDGLCDETSQQQRRATKQLNIQIIKKGGVGLWTPEERHSPLVKMISFSGCNL